MTPDERDDFKANLHQKPRKPKYGPAPVDLGVRIVRKLTGSLPLKTPGLAVSLLSESTATHRDHLFEAMQHFVGEWLLNHPQYVTRDEEGWSLRAGVSTSTLAPPVETPAPRPGASAYEIMYRSEQKLRLAAQEQLAQIRQSLLELQAELGHARELVHNGELQHQSDGLQVAAAEAKAKELAEDLALAREQLEEARSRPSQADRLPSQQATPPPKSIATPRTRKGHDYIGIIRELGNPTMADIARRAGVSAPAVSQWVSKHITLLDVAYTKPMRISERKQSA